MAAGRKAPVPTRRPFRCRPLLAALALAGSAATAATDEDSAVDFAEFLPNHDMLWDRVPNRWETAPFSGNGMLGFTMYQSKDNPKNVISLFVGRHDYYDHRLPEGTNQHLWIYRCRLPLGSFQLASQGDITGCDLRLDLWNAELRGTIRTTKGSYTVRGFTHATSDTIFFETEAKDGESVAITWKPEAPYSSVRHTLETSWKSRAGWEGTRDAPYPPAPPWQLGEENGINFCFQPLYQHRGETTTGWTLSGDPAGRQVLLASVHHSFPEKNSKETVLATLARAQSELDKNAFVPAHRAWWHDYYPQSFLTLGDREKEAFYWIQMYKLASAMRANGPILDVMGPWYHHTFWPMVWGDLNVQLIYWTHLVSNRLSVGESLPNNLDKYAGNLEKNVPERWKDSAAIGALFPQDCLSHDNGKTPDMLAWILHDYWLHCEYAGDRERLRDKFFPLLRKTGNSYLNYLKENPVAAEDGKIHVRKSWSPEYPGGHGQDTNFTLALMRWTFQTLQNLNGEFALNDPLAAEWKKITDNLVGYQTDENGLRINKDMAFEKPHRHYSHLLGFFPLAVIHPDDPDNAKMLRTSLDHWLDVSINRQKGKGATDAMPVTGYTATGAASMYAWLGDADKAGYYIDYLIDHKNVSSTTMYAEGNPVIESPLSFATSIHDMLLQSWDGKIRVFPAIPDKWPDAAFRDFRTQGAFLVSAKRQGGKTEFVSVTSETGQPCVIRPGIADPAITIDGNPPPDGAVEKLAGGFYRVDLPPGARAVFAREGLGAGELVIAPLVFEEKDKNLFGLHQKTERLPGHRFYHKE
jgi:alpha-L-fucosidase 2